jgi:hypothetical protein
LESSAHIGKIVLTVYAFRLPGVIAPQATIAYMAVIPDK